MYVFFCQMATMNEGEYFLGAIHLFRETKWLYNAPVTELLTEGLLDTAVPNQSWLNELQQFENQELNDLVAKKVTTDQCSDSLKEFAEKCVHFDRLPASANGTCPILLPGNFKIGIGFKKQQEITCFAYFVHEHCAKLGIKYVIDLGAGLGYVCQLLHQLYGYRVLGLERSQDNVNKARVRQEKMYPNSLRDVKYECCELTSNSAETIERLLENQFDIGRDQKVCLIGLHACGDLGIHSSKIFSNMNRADILIIMPCCYHKLSLSNDYFPLSRRLRTMIDSLNCRADDLFREPFLRLACQEPAHRWTDMSTEAHRKHSFYVLARAVLELYAKNNGLSVKKRVRKGTRKSQCINFETYVKDSLYRYSFESRKTEKESGESNERAETSFEVHEEKLMKLWNEHCDKLKFAEIYSGLQLMLQASAESLVLYDRLSWLQEEQGLHAVVSSVINQSVSPRSFAIVSRKR